MGKALDDKAVATLVKTILAVDKKGYSKKVKVSIGIATAALIGAAVYYGASQIIAQSTSLPFAGQNVSQIINRKNCNVEQKASAHKVEVSTPNGTPPTSIS